MTETLSERIARDKGRFPSLGPNWQNVLAAEEETLMGTWCASPPRHENMVQIIFEASFHVLQKHLWHKMEGPLHENKRMCPKAAWPQAPLVNNEHVIWTWVLPSNGCSDARSFHNSPGSQRRTASGKKEGAFPSTSYNLFLPNSVLPGGGGDPSLLLLTT